MIRRADRIRARAPRDLVRRLVTPEGIPLRIELGSATNRALAFLIDFAIIAGILIALTIGLAFLSRGLGTQGMGALMILWLIGFFLLRNAWFILFEGGGRAATIGKRAMGLRVVARDGGQLTGAAITARNAMREIEIFLPLSFLGARAAENGADATLTLMTLVWSGIFLFFPLFNRDRLRVGDLVAGTWVVQTVKARLLPDLAMEMPRRSFSREALGLYGAFELQKLAEVLRGGDGDSITIVASTIRRKAGIPDDGDDAGFLADYYQALGAWLERDLLFGKRRADKTDTAA
ncbi:RDD family protein [Sphingomonas sp.]|uniref:RDD family protein n=1 Tax=Sphingomonas sp. TaxID=28214 RepID=UPI0025F6EE75|nr:RDD family protein [Sphingomonas sp.]